MSNVQSVRLTVKLERPQVSVMLGVPTLQAGLKGGAGGTGTRSPYFRATFVDFASPDFYYFGGEPAGWRVIRYRKGDVSDWGVATIANNPGATTIGQAWSDRLSLVYSVEG